MKLFNKYLAFFVTLIVATGFAFAHGNKSSNNEQHGMWTCETNASSSSSYTSNDNTSNTNNTNAATNSSSSSEQSKPRSAREAFAYALKNCKANKRQHTVIARSVFCDEALRKYSIDMATFLDCHSQQKTLGSQ